MRFVAIIIVLVISSAAWADTTLQCSETEYDKTGNNPYEVPHYFVLQDGGIFRKAILHWDNKKVDLSLVTNTQTTIEATGKAMEYMPLPVQIDQCVKADVANNPKMRDANGEINYFTVLECTTKAGVSDSEIPIDVNVTINRVTGNLTIHRRQDNNSQHDTQHSGSCKAAKPLYQMRAATLLEHCTKSFEPDGFCLGYMEAALDFITEYQLWMTLNRYEYPPGDKAICVKGTTPAHEVAKVFVRWMKSHDIGWTAANAGVGDAVRNAYACKK